MTPSAITTYRDGSTFLTITPGGWAAGGARIYAGEVRHLGRGRWEAYREADRQQREITTRAAARDWVTDEVGRADLPHRGWVNL